MRPNAERPSGSRVFSTNNVIALDHRRYSHPWLSILHAAFHANYFSLRANKNIRPPGDLRGQRQSNVQLGTRIQILANHKIQSASRNISRRSLVPSDKFFSGESDADWQCQV